MIWLLVCTLACTSEPELEPEPVPEPPADTAPPELACPVFGDGEELGAAEPEALREASGLAAVDGLLWTHNDSGSAPGLFALNRDGSTRAAVAIDGVVAADLEDVAHLDGKLLVGDIGDNAAVRAYIGLIEVDVPDLEGSDGSEAVPGRSIRLSWDVGARDAETLLADPVSGDVLVISKELDGNSRVGRVASPLPDEGVLETVAVVPFGGSLLPGNTLTTGGDIAPDGTGVVVRTYLGAWVWPRRPGEPWSDTFSRPACPVALEPEPQGEAIAWGSDGLYTLSEGVGEPVWFYPLLSR